MEVRELRAAVRLSLPHFARRAGVSVGSVRNWERGTHSLMPSSKRLLDQVHSGLSRSQRDRFEQALQQRSCLSEVDREDALDLDRRHLLELGLLSAAALALPPDFLGGRHTPATYSRRSVSRADVEAVRDMIALLSQTDQRRGGGHGRTAAMEYLRADVATSLHGRFPDTDVRRDLFSAAGELAYLCGWMAFDDGDHGAARRHYDIAVELADEAGDPPLAGHVLRAMAHQALDLGHRYEALALGAAAVEGARHTLASRRERALLGVVHARALAATRQPQSAMNALRQAEEDLTAATPDDEAPSRVFFFGEASLAHETARTLHDLGEVQAAVAQFERSIRLREAARFTRTHAVTLGYLGALQLESGSLDEACHSWAQALNFMDGIRSGRTRQVAVAVRNALRPHLPNATAVVIDVDMRAAEHLRRYVPSTL